jgi:NADPH-ferrihemoprotein reductase
VLSLQLKSTMSESTPMDTQTLGIFAAVLVIVGSAVYLGMGGGGSVKPGGGGGAGSSTGAAAKKEEKAKADENKFPAGPMKIFFGSQTGTAEGFGRTLMEEAKQNGFDAETVDLEDFEPEELADITNAVFLMATYGEGEPTDNSSKFMGWIREQSDPIEAGFLAKCCFTVFGLGNTQYEHYNKMGRSTNELLEKHGARRVCAYGEGDDDSTLEEDFDKWRDAMWPVMIAAFHPDGAAADEDGEGLLAGEGGMSESRKRSRTTSKVDLEFTTRVVMDEEVADLKRTREYDLGHLNAESMKLVSSANPAKQTPKSLDVSGKIQIHSSSKFYFISAECPVSLNRELRTPADGGCTRHVEVDISNSGLSYQTADNLAVLPENSAGVVADLCSSMGYQEDEFFVLEACNASTKFKHQFPTPCTVGDALRRYCDIQCIPRHATVCSLLPYVTDVKQRQWLEDLTDKNNRPKFKAYIEEGGRSLSLLLGRGGDLSSCRLPLADFIHITPRLQPRYYTISSSSSVHPTSIHVTVALTEKILPDGRKFQGVCSSDLVSHDPTAGSSLLRVFVRASTFRLPESLSTPVLMVGPGTGIAPMRALLQEREHQQQQQQQLASAKKSSSSKKNNSSSAATMENVLYFGCKDRNQDYIYQDELLAFEQSGVLTQLHVAFSREQKKKVYVQHLVQRPEDAAAICRMLLDEGGHVYVCGATAMGNDVHEALLSVLQQTRGMTAAAAASYLKELSHSGRYVQELWSA